MKYKAMMSCVRDKIFVGMLVAEPGTRTIERWQENIKMGIRLLDCKLDEISSTGQT